MKVGVQGNNGQVVAPSPIQNVSVGGSGHPNLANVRACHAGRSKMSNSIAR